MNFKFLKIFFLLGIFLLSFEVCTRSLTPFDFADSGDWLSVIDLLERGADVNRQNNKGETLLHLAMKTKDLSVIDDILQFKPDPDLRDEKNESPYSLWSSFKGKLNSKQREIINKKIDQLRMETFVKGLESQLKSQIKEFEKGKKSVEKSANFLPPKGFLRIYFSNKRGSDVSFVLKSPDNFLMNKVFLKSGQVEHIDYSLSDLKFVKKNQGGRYDDGAELTFIEGASGDTKKQLKWTFSIDPERKAVVVYFVSSDEDYGPELLDSFNRDKEKTRVVKHLFFRRDSSATRRIVAFNVLLKDEFDPEKKALNRLYKEKEKKLLPSEGFSRTYFFNKSNSDVDFILKSSDGSLEEKMHLSPNQFKHIDYSQAELNSVIENQDGNSDRANFTLSEVLPQGLFHKIFKIDPKSKVVFICYVDPEDGFGRCRDNLHEFLCLFGLNIKKTHVPGYCFMKGYNPVSVLF